MSDKKDLEMLNQARNEAKEILVDDPSLTTDPNKKLKQELTNNFENKQLSVS